MLDSPLPSFLVITSPALLVLAKRLPAAGVGRWAEAARGRAGGRAGRTGPPWEGGVRQEEEQKGSAAAAGAVHACLLYSAAGCAVSCWSLGASTLARAFFSAGKRALSTPGRGPMGERGLGLALACCAR